MRRSFCLIVGALTFSPLFACGDSGGTGGSTGTGSTSTTSTSTGTGGALNSGMDCDSAADCPPDGDCVELTPGGFRVCQFPVVEATMCINSGSGGGGTGGAGTGGAGTGGAGTGGGATGPVDECCDSDGCNNRCVLAPVLPSCGGPVEAPHNVCTDGQNQCDTAQDCGGNICAPSGTIGNKVRQCIEAKCGTDSECTAEDGGRCQLVFEPCCGLARGLFCVYPTGGCRKNEDCDAGNYCDVTGNDAKCVAGTPTCPN